MKILKSNYRYADFLTDQTQLDMWFNSLNRYTYDDVRNAVIKYSEENRQTPVLSDIVSYTRVEKRDRETEAGPVYSKFKNCPACRNSGYIFFYYGRNGNRYTKDDFNNQAKLGISVYESCRPCFECNRAKDKLPEWYQEWLGAIG